MTGGPKTHGPTIGLLASACLFVLAAAYYPGGTTFSASTVGYDWTRNFIATLFAPTALNGSANAARSFAIPAMLLLCASLAFVFKNISRKAKSKVHRKTIEIAGIGSMVYSSLVVTPMHNLMVNIGLLFFVAAVLATLHALYVERELRLLLVGLLGLVLLLVSAVMYYGNVLYELLPIFQKASFIACAGWLVAVHYSEFGGTADASATPRKTVEPTR